MARFLNKVLVGRWGVMDKLHSSKFVNQYSILKKFTESKAIKLQGFKLEFNNKKRFSVWRSNIGKPLKIFNKKGGLLLWIFN